MKPYGRENFDPCWEAGENHKYLYKVPSGKGNRSKASKRKIKKIFKSEARRRNKALCKEVE